MTLSYATKNLPRFFLFLACLFLSGCGGVGGSLGEWLGVVDPPSPPVVTVDVLCDHSSGSSCDERSLASTLELVLQRVVQSPGSEVRVWSMGDDLTSTVLVARQSVTAPAKSGVRAQRAHDREFLNAAREVFQQATASMFSQHRRRSPIAESLALVALSSTPQTHHRIIVALTDAREESRFAHFECGSLPSTEPFLDSLHAEGVLMPGSLASVNVIFSFAGLTPVEADRCRITIDRFTRTQEIWRAVIQTAGGAFVFLTGGITSGDLT